MTTLKILQYPDSLLRRKAKFVDDVKSKKIQKIIEDMKETLQNSKNCAALASTQLDIEDPPHLTVINCPETNKILCLINLEIIEKQGSEKDIEGCMSVYPNTIHAKVERATKIKIRALNQNGDQLEFEATDFMARCIQHEYDHLCGILYIDHLSKIKRNRIDKKISKIVTS